MYLKRLVAAISLLTFLSIAPSPLKADPVFNADAAACVAVAAVVCGAVVAPDAFFGWFAHLQENPVPYLALAAVAGWGILGYRAVFADAPEVQPAPVAPVERPAASAPAPDDEEEVEEDGLFTDYRLIRHIFDSGLAEAEARRELIEAPRARTLAEENTIDGIVRYFWTPGTLSLEERHHIEFLIENLFADEPIHRAHHMPLAQPVPSAPAFEYPDLFNF
jgi:hypothetical protein